MGDATAKVSRQLRFDHGMQKIRRSRRLILCVERQQQLDHVHHKMGDCEIRHPSEALVGFCAWRGELLDSFWREGGVIVDHRTLDV